jgi:hypothetical protein
LGEFLDGHAALLLVAIRLHRIARAKWGKQRYLAMETYPHPLPEEATA